MLTQSSAVINGIELSSRSGSSAVVFYIDIGHRQIIQSSMMLYKLPERYLFVMHALFCIINYIIYLIILQVYGATCPSRAVYLGWCLPTKLDRERQSFSRRDVLLVGEVRRQSGCGSFHSLERWESGSTGQITRTQIPYCSVSRSSW